MSSNWPGFEDESSKQKDSSTSQSGTASSSGAGTVDKAKEAFGGVQQKAGEIGDQAASKVDAGKDKAADGLESLASTLRDKGQFIGDGRVQNIATAAVDKIESGSVALRTMNTDQVVADIESFIRRKPVESLLVAVGAGFLLSRTFR